MSLRTPNKTKSSLSGSPATPSNDARESRKRQSRRDEAIRRRVENDISKKRYTKSSSTKKHQRSYHPGTVLALKPTEAVFLKPSYTVYEAAQLMSAKRENCILVVDNEEHLLGIFTAKDLAFRVVGKGFNAANMLIQEIMTPNPLCATADTPASEALNLMVQRGFRHLPVLDENSQVIGVLDITKCYQEAMEKLERMYVSSKKLHDALEGVQNEMGMSQQPLQVIKYFENLKSVTNGPTLESVLDDRTIPSYVNVKTSVYDAALLMKENRTTAVLVKDPNDDVTGIFTSKDVVLRVIAAGLNPKTVSVIRVMTAQPDVAPKDLTIQAALRKMFDGHYLNLPVVENNEIIGIVEVLKLTYSTLDQISLVQTNEEDNESNSEGPAWNRFWKSLDDNESVLSDSQIGTRVSGIPDISQSEINQFSMNGFNNVHDNLGPSDSISVANDHNNISQVQSTVDIKELSFAFKFKSPCSRVHRVNFRPADGFNDLKAAIKLKLTQSELEKLSYDAFAISYVDDEDDVIAITNDQDLIDCVLINRNSRLEKADIFIHHPDEAIDIDEYNQKKNKTRGTTKSESNGEIISGVSNQVVICGVIAAIGAALVIVCKLGGQRK